MTLIYEEVPEFKKDFKRLSKRFRTLPNDLITLKKAAIELHHVQKIDNQACFVIPGCVTELAAAHKVKKFACRSIQGGSKSGLRLIYIYVKSINKVILIEIYYKGDKALEDRERIKHYLNELSLLI